MFLYYHAYAYNHANLTATDDRIRLWFPLGWFFEAGSIGKVWFVICCSVTRHIMLYKDETEELLLRQGSF